MMAAQHVKVATNFLEIRHTASVSALVDFKKQLQTDIVQCMSITYYSHEFTFHQICVSIKINISIKNQLIP